jgi:hypothetical protein
VREVVNPTKVAGAGGVFKTREYLLWTRCMLSLRLLEWENLGKASGKKQECLHKIILE